MSSWKTKKWRLSKCKGCTTKVCQTAWVQFKMVMGIANDHSLSHTNFRLAKIKPNEKKIRLFPYWPKNAEPVLKWSKNKYKRFDDAWGHSNHGQFLDIHKNSFHTVKKIYYSTVWTQPTSCKPVSLCHLAALFRGAAIYVSRSIKFELFWRGSWPPVSKH